MRSSPPALDQHHELRRATSLYFLASPRPPVASLLSAIQFPELLYVSPLPPLFILLFTERV